MTKGCLNGTKRHIINVVGFRARMKTANGTKVLKNRRKKGRKILTKLSYSK